MRPERQAIDLGVEHFQTGALHHLKQLVDVLHVDGNVVDGAAGHSGLSVLIGLYHEVVELEERHLLCAVDGTQGLGKAEREIEVDGLLDVVCGDADVLNARCEIFDVHHAFGFKCLLSFAVVIYRPHLYYVFCWLGLQVQYLRTYLEVGFLRLWIPHAHGMHRQRVGTYLQVVAHLQLRMYDARRCAVEVLLFASLVQGEGSAQTSVHLPSLLVVEGVFGVNKRRVFLLLVVDGTVAAKHDGRPAEEQRELRLLKAVAQRAVEEAARLVCRIVEILMVVVGGAGREVVGVHGAELQSSGAQRDVMVHLLVGALRVGSAPQAERGVPIGKGVAKVCQDKATVGHLHAAPQMVVLQTGRKVHLRRSR